MISEKRLGQVYCNLNCWRWDDLLGPKPEGFDFMSHDEKHRVINPAFNLILSILGETAANKWWWILELGRSEQDWVAWRLGDDRYLLPEEEEEYEEEED